MVIFKGLAINQNALGPSITDVLNYAECPMILVTTKPACTGLYVYFTMQPSSLANNNQQVQDSSGNNIHAINGASSSAEATDATSGTNGLIFDGSTFIQLTGLSPSSRGFSLEFQIIPSYATTDQFILKDTTSDKFKVIVNKFQNKVAVFIDGETVSTTQCTMSCKCESTVELDWNQIALSIDADDSQTFAMIFCGQQLKHSVTISKKLDFPMSNFKIGEGYNGQIREFKMYKVSLGAQSLTKETTISGCSAGQFDNAGVCADCFALCSACTATSNGSCTACDANATLDQGSCQCDSNYYNDNGVCTQCDSLCDGCTGAGSTNCSECNSNVFKVNGTSTTCVSSCATGYYPLNQVCYTCDPLCHSCFGAGNTACGTCAAGTLSVEDSNTCVAKCEDLTGAYYTDSLAESCKTCNSVCAACNDGTETGCTSCAANALQVINSPLANPVHCLASCDPTTYQSGQTCLGKTCSLSACVNNCATCTAETTCQSCDSGFFLQPSSPTCEDSCPSGYFPNSVTNECEACTHAQCLSCLTSPSVCTSCNSATSYYADSNTCQLCSSPSVLQNRACIDCTQRVPLHQENDQGECVEFCGDGTRSSHECDDGNQLDGDGCSSSCTVQPNFSCQGGSLSSPDICTPFTFLSLRSVSLNEDSYSLLIKLNYPVQFKQLTLPNLNFAFSQDSNNFQPTIHVGQESYGDNFVVFLQPSQSIYHSLELDLIIRASLAFQPLSGTTVIIPTNLQEFGILLPPKLIVSEQLALAIQATGRSFQAVTILLMVGLSLSQYLLQSSLQAMWGLINVSQLIFYIPLMRVLLPPNTLFLFEFLAFFNGDLYVIQAFYQLTIARLLEPSDQYESASHFSHTGMESTLLPSNAGILITTYAIVLLLLVLTLFLSLCVRSSSRSTKCKRCVFRMKNCLSWNFILRLLIETYLDIGLCALLNILSLRLDSPLSIASSLLALCLALLYFLLPFLVLRVIVQPLGTLFILKKYTKFNMLYETMNRQSSLTNGLFYPLFLLHRLVFIVNVFLLPPLVQVLVMALLTLLFALYFMLFHPFKSKLDRGLQIFSHTLLTAIYIMVLVIGFIQEYQTREQIGLGLIIVVGVLFIGNIGTIVIAKIVDCRAKCKEKKKRQRLYQARLSIERPLARNNSMILKREFIESMKKEPNLKLSVTVSFARRVPSSQFISQHTFGNKTTEFQ